jgi:uncharacterized protein (TIGR03067 family)
MLSLLVVSAVFAAPVPEKALQPALKELQGEWRAVSVEEKGEAWGNKEEVAEVVLEVTGDSLIYKRNTPVEKFRIILNPDKKPAQMDLRLIADGVDPARACHAIYTLEGGKLKLCLPSEFTASNPEARPREFTTGGERPPQGKLLFVMARAKKEQAEPPAGPTEAAVRFLTAWRFAGGPGG